MSFQHTGYLPMDKRVRERVSHIVNNLHVSQPALVLKHLTDFVETNLFDENPPPKTDRRFYPTAKDLKNCIDNVTAATQ